jgi:glycosyltransferase involved in cell wall biosynthesis
MNIKPKIALWFRYGPAEHTELFHAMPRIVESLAQHSEVHYFGLRSRKPVPEAIQHHAIIHHLPFTINRTSGRDKVIKTGLWLMSLPWIGSYCKHLGIQAVYIDETIPFTAGLARMFFGSNVAMTVADFFLDIYADRRPLLRPFARWVQAYDFSQWKQLPLIFTRAGFTRQFLASKGCNPDRVHPVYDPCDMTVYRPIDKAMARRQYGYEDRHTVLVHHGILHPNKGNDRIIRALAEMRDRLPDLRYLLIGDGPDMPRLRELVRELHLESVVTFTGWIEKLEDVNVALNAGDIGLVMRIGQFSDNFHTTGALVHSMACGLPILAARLGGVSEIVQDDINGYLFDPQDLSEFKTRFQALAADRALRERLGAKAHAMAVDLFDMDSVTRRTVEPLMRLLCKP